MVAPRSTTAVTVAATAFTGTVAGLFVFGTAATVEATLNTVVVTPTTPAITALLTPIASADATTIATLTYTSSTCVSCFHNFICKTIQFFCALAIRLGS